MDPSAREGEAPYSSALTSGQAFVLAWFGLSETRYGSATWAANRVSALAFAAVHLPAWYAVGPLSLGLALIVLTLNGLGGAVFGYVFITRGIVAAMWAHAGADVAMQSVGPLTR